MPELSLPDGIVDARRSNPQHYGYNVGCLEGVDPSLIEPVRTGDGVNHPSDRQEAPPA